MRKKVIITTLLAVIFASCSSQKLTIKNLHDDPLLLIKEKDCKIQIGTIRIIHPINISLIEETAGTLVSSSYKSNVKTSNPLTNILKHKTKKLYNNLYQLKPRDRHRTRRWNAIGTVWKWIAGTPDATDLQAINTTMNDLIDQNNHQFKVNQNINDRIQQLTHAINEVTRQAQHNDIMMKDMEIITSILNIDILNQLLEDIQDAIMLSKLSITTNKILSIREILTVKELLQDQGIDIHLPDEALQFVTPKFATSPGVLLYFMHVPLLENTTSSIIRIYPFINRNQSITQYPEYVVKSGSHIFTTRNPNDYVQKFAYLRDLDDGCVNPLINGRKPECSVKSNSQTTYRFISDNTLLVSNARNQKLESNCGPDNRSIEGNLLIHFVNCTIRIDNQTFRSEEHEGEPDFVNSAFYNLEPAWKLEEEHDLREIHQDTTKNRKHLEHVYLEQNELKFKFWSLFGGLSTTGLVTIVIIILIAIKTYGTGRSFLQGGVVTETPRPDTSNIIINQIETIQQQQQLLLASLTTPESSQPSS